MNLPTKVASFAFILCVVYLMIAGVLLRWLIDDEKLKEHSSAKLFRSVIPPRSILTAFGLKVWWSRIFVGGAGIISLILSFALRDP